MFAREEGPKLLYDIDHGNKTSLATGVERSPLRYSIIRSTAPRFHDRQSQVPFGTYATDCAHKKTLSSFSRDNRRFYASSFESKAPRFGRPWTSPTTDALYDVSMVSNSRPATIEHGLETTAQSYSILRSSYTRFPTQSMGQGPDVIYEIDRGRKATMYTSMIASPITYKNMGAQPSEPVSGKQRISSNDHLGPGCYDFKHSSELRASPYTDYRPLSSMCSRSPRFGSSRNGPGSLGSTWSQDKDTKAWADKGFKMGKAEYLRPQYLPNYYKKGLKK